MKAFRFRLEPVLVLRRQKEEASKAGYAMSVQERVAVERQRDALKMEICALKDRIAETRKGSFSGGMQQGYNNALLENERALEQVGETLFNAFVNEENALRIYIASKRDRELVDHWKDRQRKEHFQEVIKEEEQEIEDLANARYIRMRQMEGALV